MRHLCPSVREQGFLWRGVTPAVGPPALFSDAVGIFQLLDKTSGAGVPGTHFGMLPTILFLSLLPLSAQVHPPPSGSAGVGAGPVVVPDGDGEGFLLPPSSSSNSSRSLPDPPQKAK